MNRRMFIRTTGAAGLGLIGRFGLTETGSVPVLLKLLEESPRERVPRELAAMIRGGLRYEDLLAALSLAAVRNVQPYPDVGFKYHAVMMLRSIHSTTQHLPSADRWLPIVWAADCFKDAQAQERVSSGWRMPTRVVSPNRDQQAARRSLVGALDNWDRDAADTAIVESARAAHPDEIFALLFPYGARDLRAIGHKAIAVSNAHSLMTLFGAAQAEPLLRSTVAALQNDNGGPNPAHHDLEPDRAWRDNRNLLAQIPPSWRQGHDDRGARTELRAALYQVSDEEAGGVVVGLLRRGVSPEAIWRVLFDIAAELLMLQPGIVPLHAQTTANALHYAYRVCGDGQTQQLLLLQCAAFMALFRRIANATATDLDLEELQPLPLERAAAQTSLEEIFSDVSASQRLRAARKTLGYLRNQGDAAALIATARHHLVYNADEAHDYKFSEAVLDTHDQLQDAGWRQRFLSAAMAYFKAPAKQPVPIVQETIELLRN
jgi:hypothetical protein